ncbi:hypothetical protein CSUB01_12652, partial [Colletotrichum sublineola]
ASQASNHPVTPERTTATREPDPPQKPRDPRPPDQNNMSSQPSEKDTSTFSPESQGDPPTEGARNPETAKGKEVGSQDPPVKMSDPQQQLHRAGGEPHFTQQAPNSFVPQTQFPHSQQPTQGQQYEPLHQMPGQFPGTQGYGPSPYSIGPTGFQSTQASQPTQGQQYEPSHQMPGQFPGTQGYRPSPYPMGPPGFQPTQASQFTQGQSPPQSGQTAYTPPNQTAQAPTQTTPSDGTVRHIPPQGPGPAVPQTGPAPPPDTAAWTGPPPQGQPPAGPPAWQGPPPNGPLQPSAPTGQGSSPTDPTINTPQTSQADALVENLLRALTERLSNAALVTTNTPLMAARNASTEPRVGTFWPDADVKKYSPEPIFHDYRATYYRDVELWIQAVESLLPDWGAVNEVSRNIAQYLRGSARNWWEFQLSDSERTRLKAQGWTTIANRIKLRFGPTIGDAQKWFRENSFSMEKVSGDNDIRAFAQECFKYARAWGDHSNKQLLTRLYYCLAPQLRQFLYEPTDVDSLDSYVTLVEDRRKA